MTRSCMFAAWTWLLQPESMVRLGPGLYTGPQGRVWKIDVDGRSVGAAGVTARVRSALGRGAALEPRGQPLHQPREPSAPRVHGGACFSSSSAQRA